MLGGTNPPSTGGITNEALTSDSWDFDDTTEESVGFKMVMPDDWDRSTIKAKVYSTTAAAAGTNVWGVSAVAISHNDPLGPEFGTEITVTNTVTAASDLHVSPATQAITVGGSPALADAVFFKIARKQSADYWFEGDMKLLGIAIQYKLLTTQSAAW